METSNTVETLVVERKKRFVSDETRQKMRLAKLGKKRGQYKPRKSKVVTPVEAAI